MPLKKYLEGAYGRFATARAVRLHLIEEVRKDPRIYTNSRLSAKLRDDYFAPITRRLGYRLYEEVYGAWKSLREAFKREQRKIDRGRAADGDITWAFFRQMKWLASVSIDDDDDGDNQAVREEDEEEEDEREDAAVLDGRQGQARLAIHSAHVLCCLHKLTCAFSAAEENIAEPADVHHNDHDGDAEGTGNDLDYGHGDNNDDNGEEVVDVGVHDPPQALPSVEYYVEQPAYLERLPELMDAVERALFGQPIGMRLKDLPSHKQGKVVDAINKIFNDAEEETAAEAARQEPPSAGSPVAPDAVEISGDMSDNELTIDENYDPGMHKQ